MSRDGTTSALMLDALAVAAGRCPPDADPVAALVAADLPELIAEIYDRLSEDHPRQLLTGRRLAALLCLIGLPEAGLPGIVSYADVNTVLIDRFADAFGVAPRDTPSVGDVLEILMADPNAAESDWDNLRVLAALDELRGVHRMRVTDERAILAALTQDNLARTVMRQQEQIKRLRAFVFDLTTELRQTSAEALAAQTLLSMTEKRRPSIDSGHPIERSRSAGCFVGQLEALKTKLQRLRPAVKELERRQTVMEQSWSSQSSKKGSVFNDSGTQGGDKSCAEDSGWMTDDDFDGPESRTISQSSSDKALNLDSNTLPSMKSGSLSVARLKVTESFIQNNTAAVDFRTKLATLSVKLRDTERKLSALSKSEYSPSNAGESCPVAI